MNVYLLGRADIAAVTIAKDAEDAADFINLFVEECPECVSEQLFGMEIREGQVRIVSVGAGEPYVPQVQDTNTVEIVKRENVLLRKLNGELRERVRKLERKRVKKGEEE